MDLAALRRCLTGCYVTVPTLFHEDLSVDLAGIRRHVRFLVGGGIRTGTGVILAGGAAGDFSTLTFDERVAVAEAVVEAAEGEVPVAIGAQTTSTLELVRLARAAERLGAGFIQVSPPYYFAHTEDDLFEFIRAATEAADVGVVVYNTYWTSSSISCSLLERLADLPAVIGLKWACPDHGRMEFERVVASFARRFSIIDNQLRFVTSHILGARAIEVHICNFWPEWGVRLWRLLEAGEYVAAQRELVRVALPFMSLWETMETYTSGDGYLDKLCMELIGLGSSRCRPPTRDVREQYRASALSMLVEIGVPGIATGVEEAGHVGRRPDGRPAGV